MQINAELYKTILENLIKDAAADGYDLYAEVYGEAEEGNYGSYIDLNEVALTFSNQARVKGSPTFNSDLDYASVDSSLYSSDVA